MTGTTASPNQIECVDYIIQELTQNGVMEIDRLNQTPFIDINPLGPEGVFPSAKVDRLVEALSEIRSRAA
ncbi:hypothetical protein F6R98_07750 [Candidatus Methylospira mobilis]|uniref:EcoEI R protein C-terminal domain-containing protein n=1 Tax=Candidatus Methylospira mobilis TaxID=1808979 RepID=A0A5Q0BF91_9GAMM|nr:type I restriction-modification enzyme R subunit C-terminal domain-containing protein [Candidatus Methylospira mobilis]QFY42533.1 hypothetical protein F6R98_07750 [Candidatus Methylospira mobilis]WNV06892.1 type I restriction-modification enzyme R subunit C-terminal domain-containing protein [Candidatus Methylospira mobilis]